MLVRFSALRAVTEARVARFATDEVVAATPDLAGEPPTPPAATLDVARQAQARRYARQQQRLSLINLGLSALLVGVLLFSGLSFWLRDTLAVVPAWEPFADWQPLRVGAYFLVLFVAAFIIGLPLSYYSGYTLPRRNGVSTQSLRGWLADEAKGLALGLVFEIVAVVGVYALLAASPRWWWLWAGGALLCVTALLANLAPVLLMPLFYKLTPLPDGDVRRRALALAERAHTRVRGIYAMNMSARTTAANAMVTGLGATRRIVIGDTLLDHYTPDEIEVVVAHELGHQVHRDIPRLIVMQTVVMLGGLYLVSLTLAATLRAFPQYHGLADPATMPLIAATLGVFGLVTLPLTNGFSRWVEHRGRCLRAGIHRHDGGVHQRDDTPRQPESRRGRAIAHRRIPALQSSLSRSAPRIRPRLGAARAGRRGGRWRRARRLMTTEAQSAYPLWARDELTALAARYGAPIVGVTRDADAAAYLATIKTRRRPGEVCMVVRRRSGKLLIATKDIYPAGVYRLLTGGVHRGESVFRALLRETHEETDLTVATRRFLAVARYQPPGAPEPVEYATFAFLLDEIAGELRVNDPDEGLTDFREVAPAELLSIAEQLDSQMDAPSDDLESSYRAWGHFRAPMHRLVWQALGGAQI